MGKIYNQSFNDRCPYTDKNETVTIKFEEFPQLNGRKALDIDCSAKACTNKWHCPIYIKNK